MALPLSYNIRNVRVRWQVTLLAISGISLVVAVFSILLSMSAGFQMALRATGSLQAALPWLGYLVAALVPALLFARRKGLQP